MARNYITKPSASAVVFPVNHRAAFDGIFIQNKTNGDIVIKVTGDNVQSVPSGSVVWSNPTTSATYPSATFTLPTLESALLQTPCTALQFSGAGVGVINVSESY